MPTYEYKCPKGHLFERTFPRITSHRYAKCAICGKRAERQISGGAGIVFKGSGFYHTDYKRNPETPEKTEKSEKPAESKPKPKQDPSSDK